MDQSAKGHAVTPTRREVLDVNVLREEEYDPFMKKNDVKVSPDLKFLES